MGTRDHQNEITRAGQAPSTAAHQGIPNREIGLPGTLINGRYLIEKQLGYGGIGIVYLARDKQLLSRHVVVKVLLDELEDSNNRVWFRKKFRQEIEALARIDHPGVIGVLDAGEMPDGKAYLVMQYVDGVVLRSKMKSEGMVFDEAASIIRQIGHALTAAHEKGVFHRDVKPENIMLQLLEDGEEQVRLIDFGIATVKESQIAADQTKTLTAGTLPYMAPEQLRGRPCAASDTFSLAVVVYEMLTGVRPFNTESPYEMLEHQKSGVRVKPTDLRPHLPIAAQAEILRALSYEPAERHPRTRDFTDALARALTEVRTAREIPANIITRDYKTTKLEEVIEEKRPEEKKPGNTWVKFAAGAALCVLALGGIFFGYRKLSPQPPVSVSPVSTATSTTTAPAPPERTLSYGIRMMRMRNGREQPLPRVNRMAVVFDQGDRIQFMVTSPQSGWLYLINERPEGAGYNLLFPLPIFQNGSAMLESGREWELPAFRFDTSPGAETVWVVWSEQQIPQFDKLIRWVNEKDMSEIRDGAEREAVRDFLRSHSAQKTEVTNDDDRKLTVIRGSGQVIVAPVRFEHF